MSKDCTVAWVTSGASPDVCHVAQTAHSAQLPHWTAAAAAAAQAAAPVTQAPAIAKAAALHFVQHCHQTACSPAGNRETSLGVELCIFTQVFIEMRAALTLSKYCKVTLTCCVLVFA